MANIVHTNPAKDIHTLANGNCCITPRKTIEKHPKMGAPILKGEVLLETIIFEVYVSFLVCSLGVGTVDGSEIRHSPVDLIIYRV